jgi:hypothetical protein
MSEKLFTEIGFDKDNNKYWFGVSSEIEKDDGTETRQTGFIKMKINYIYFRLWVGKKVLIISKKGFEITKKNRNNFKLVFGIAGVPKDDS